MKKIFGIIAALLLCSGFIFAGEKENDVEFTIGMPMLYNTDTKVALTYVSASAHFTTFTSDMLGFAGGFTLPYETGKKNFETGETIKVSSTSGLFDFDMNCGIAIRPIHKEKFDFVITPVVDIFMEIISSSDSTYLITFVGPGVQTAFTYNIMESLGITIRCDFAYYMYYFTQDGNGKLNNVMFITPQAGFTLHL